VKVLLVGCNGLLGQNLLYTAPSGISLSGISIESECYLEELEDYLALDIGNKRELKEAIAEISPDWIFNAAAMTNVDLCEKEIGQCRLLNRDAVGWMAETGLPMVHISTDYVFDGKSGPYGENDRPNPLGMYGRTKLESEPVVLDACSRSLIIRTMTLWGRGNKLRPSFVEFVKSNLQERRSITIVTDQVGNPTLAEDLAAAIWKLVEKSCSGLYHVGGSEILSRFDWAVKTAEFFNLDSSLIQPCLTSDLQQAAMRPLKSGFILDKLIKDTGFVPKNVYEQLQAAG
jgi:dTDP-4-dehydrorhamnose reductase